MGERKKSYRTLRIATVVAMGVVFGVTYFAVASDGHETVGQRSAGPIVTGAGVLPQAPLFPTVREQQPDSRRVVVVPQPKARTRAS